MAINPIPETVLALFTCAAFVSCPDTYPQDRPLFTQHERQSHASARPNPLCKPTPYETPITYSELTVFVSGEVLYQTSAVAPCLGQVGDPPWGLRWEGPSSSTFVFRHRLSALEFTQLKTFLDQEDVKEISSFMNAGPGVGDFKIAIARPTGIQNIDVLSLMPNHAQLVKYPALIDLICKAKDMARIASNSGERPRWCTDAGPLTP
jgi:hypothetical protein